MTARERKFMKSQLILWTLWYWCMAENREAMIKILREVARDIERGKLKEIKETVYERRVRS